MRPQLEGLMKCRLILVKNKEYRLIVKPNNKKASRRTEVGGQRSEIRDQRCVVNLVFNYSAKTTCPTRGCMLFLCILKILCCDRLLIATTARD